jgi:hypothetical protein
MKRFGLTTFVLALIALVAAAAANDEPTRWLPGRDIAQALGGKTLEGRYANGRAFTERYLDGGRIEYFDNGATLGGRWSIQAGTLCTIYDTDPAGGCFRVSRSGTNCFEFYFVARTEDAAPGPQGSQPSWTARGSVSGEPNTCHDGANV